jgi:hypothetical protein
VAWPGQVHVIQLSVLFQYKFKGLLIQGRWAAGQTRPGYHHIASEAQLLPPGPSLLYRSLNHGLCPITCCKAQSKPQLPFSLTFSFTLALSQCTQCPCNAPGSVLHVLRLHGKDDLGFIFWNSVEPGYPAPSTQSCTQGVWFFIFP